MQRYLTILGACLLLLAVETHAAKHSKKNFLDFGDIWGSNSASPTPTDDLTLDTEGSGSDEKIDSTHADDEDFDIGSGDDIDTKIDVITTERPETDDYYDKTSDDEDDDDDVLEGGSGSGDGVIEDEIVPSNVRPALNEKPTTRKPMTPCENLRYTALQAASAFMPDCEVDGSFKKRQCMIDLAMKEENCWCVDPRGIEISGTRMKNSEKPDCVYGENLSTCVFQLVQHSQGMLGEYKPKCTMVGEYEEIQCQGSECWCVDKIGDVVDGTIVNLPQVPKCPSADIHKPTTKPKETPLPEPDKPVYTLPEDSSEDMPNVIVNIGPEIEIDEETFIEEKEEETNAVGEFATMTHKEPILAQPGLLAAIIGGAVVGLLCMVLLVMFIVYRMRKKDEGSYPLDEQKYQNYSYTKAPDKEFYA